jgi:ribA/ribD-fused uncharacterized protein
MIDNFNGPYRFLSNFWPAQVEFDGVIYPTVEHAFVAAKTLDPTMRAVVARHIRTPSEAKRFGRELHLRPDWEQVKLGIMEDLVRQKFTKHEELWAGLTSTGNQELVEGNYWNDTFWGVCRGRGSNHLGKILMKVRAELMS